MKINMTFAKLKQLSKFKKWIIIAITLTIFGLSSLSFLAFAKTNVLQTSSNIEVNKEIKFSITKTVSDLKDFLSRTDESDTDKTSENEDSKKINLADIPDLIDKQIYFALTNDKQGLEDKEKVEEYKRKNPKVFSILGDFLYIIKDPQSLDEFVQWNSLVDKNYQQMLSSYKQNPDFFIENNLIVYRGFLLPSTSSLATQVDVNIFKIDYDQKLNKLDFYLLAPFDFGQASAYSNAKSISQKVFIFQVKKNNLLNNKTKVSEKIFQQ
ncbi:hypothetical protein MHR_0461 [Mesomycoplasma hyorhinis HUB-1]|uniref:hypothetical protein n=1 Tax=Mesomycoplasma hyorhinis TaxID=2100 RepID=UPI0001E133BF|nr:hypothetical protein MHR_0461 [Mesomycoplasma hyorhinis HUB-1]